MADISHFFPLTVFRDTLGLSKSQRKKLADLIVQSSKQKFNKNKSTSRAWTGDRHGFEFLHNQKEYNNLFKEIHKRLILYTNALSINSKNLDFFYTRSWGTVSASRENIVSHRHNQSHISVVYYLIKPTDSGNLVFQVRDPLNEFSAGLFEPYSHNVGLITESNLLNSELVTMDVEEDDIVIFPSKTYHGTEPNKSQGQRISISVDVVVTLKESTGVEFIMPSVDNWRKSGTL